MQNGIGGKTFFDLMASCDTPQEVLDKIKIEYKLGYHKAGKMAEINNLGPDLGRNGTAGRRNQSRTHQTF